MAFYFCATFYESHKEQSMPNKSFKHILQDLNTPPPGKKKVKYGKFVTFHLYSPFVVFSFFAVQITVTNMMANH